MGNENEVTKRKEVWLTEEVLQKLEEKAKADHRPLKPYMEKVLIEHVNGKNETIPTTNH